MRDINIGIEGVSLKVDSESFWVASEVPLQVVSSSVVGGDLKETSNILSVRVPADPCLLYTTDAAAEEQWT